jgi:hypothetical protein
MGFSPFYNSVNKSRRNRPANSGKYHNSYFSTPELGLQVIFPTPPEKWDLSTGYKKFICYLTAFGL